MEASVRLAVSLILVIYNSSLTFLISVFSKGPSSHITVAISFSDFSALAGSAVMYNASRLT